jgi:hypothetical protein
MKKQCRNCENWKSYIKRGVLCLCSSISGGNYYEVYTPANDCCKCWIKRIKHYHFKSLLKWIDKNHVK